jgi:hypothetical protein
MCSTAFHYFYPMPKIGLLKIDVCIYEYDVVLQRHKIFSYIENAIDLVGSKLFG